MGGGRDSTHKVGQWGQFDPTRQGDAAKFEYYGGTEDQYKNMTEEQQQQYLDLLESQRDPKGLGGKPWEEQQNALKAFVASLSGGKQAQPGAPGATPQAGAPGEFMRAATPGVNTPFGNQTWGVDANGQWTMTQGLSPGLQSGLDSLQAQWSKALQKGLDDGNTARQQAIDAAYGQATSRLDPQWKKREEAQRTQLLNQGLTDDSEAYKNAMQDLNFARNDAYSSAMNSAVAQGTAAGDSVFRNNLAAYNNPLQQIATLKGLSQFQNNPALLNALIAQKNNEMGKASMLQQQQADAMAGGMDLVKAYLQYL